MADGEQARLGAVQETLFIPLLARARETRKKRPLLRDPKAVEMAASAGADAAKYGRGAGGWVTILRTVIFDSWVRAFVSAHPGGTVVEIGTGLNARFERVDNGAVHWLDLDLPDTIALRRKFFADTPRRRMVAASATSPEWLESAAGSPGPYFFVADGVLVYLPEDEVTRLLSRIAGRFPGAWLALDTYSGQMMRRQHQMAARRGIAARWAWACDDPRSLEHLGLRLVESATVTRPPAAVRAGLPPAHRYLLPLADPLLGRAFRLSLFRTAG